MAVLSVDLAHQAYADFGAVVLTLGSKEILVDPVRIPLSGNPSPERLADFLAAYCAQAEIRLLLLDGPQAWKAENNGLVHSRVCERELNTPAKTGLPNCVKPANYRPFVEFSIAVFDALADVGWQRLATTHSPLARSRIAVESFPLSAWRSLRLAPLPAKRKTRLEQMTASLEALVALVSVRPSSALSHDQLQATVAGIAGLALEAEFWAGCAIAGVAPVFEGGVWREGFIVNALPTFCAAVLKSAPTSTQAEGIVRRPVSSRHTQG